MKKILSVILTFVVSVSAAFAFASCQDVNDEIKKVKNLIIIIGDGMGLEHIKAAEIYEGEDYGFTNWHQTTVNTDSYLGENYYTLTDSAAGGTAIATGTLTVNGYVGVDHKGEELSTIMDVAKQKGKATAVLTTDTIYGATPASFSAHALNRGNSGAIAVSQLTSSNVDLLCGTIDGITTAGYIKECAAENGYVYCDSPDQAWSTVGEEKAYWQLDLAGVNATVELCEATSYALEFVEKDEDGFVMMIEQAHVDKYSHGSDFIGAICSVISLKNTVQTVMDWMGDRDDTAVLITADHETGGLAVSDSEEDYPRSFEKSNGQLGSYFFSTGDHTRSYVGLFVYGAKPNFSAFEFYASNSYIKNTETYKLMEKLI